jgi:hypothetical protein
MSGEVKDYQTKHGSENTRLRASCLTCFLPSGFVSLLSAPHFLHPHSTFLRYLVKKHARQEKPDFIALYFLSNFYVSILACG